MLRIIVCGYQTSKEITMRCHESIAMQTYLQLSNYTNHVSIIEHDFPRKFLPQNTVDTISRASCSRLFSGDDIIVCVDADDFLIDEDAFRIINDTYESNPTLLLTYGSYVNLSNNKRGKFCGEYSNGESFRHSPWRGSHLKTFKYKLWQALPKTQLQWDDGEWFECCADRAMMIPMMELAGYDRIKYIDMLLYCYNDLNPLSVWKTNREESIETRDFIASRFPLQRCEKL